MHAQIKIVMDNAAFEEPNTELELAGILRSIADRVEQGDKDFLLADFNGNTVGTFKIVGQPRRFAR